MSFQKQTLSLLEEMLDSLESISTDGIVDNSKGLLMLLYLERVADFAQTYPDAPAKDDKEENYKLLESLRGRIADLSERLPAERRKELLERFNDTTAVTSMISVTDEKGDKLKESSKSFVDDWIANHPKDKEA